MLRVLLPDGELTLSTRVAFLAERKNEEGRDEFVGTLPSSKDANSLYVFLKSPQTTHFGVLVRKLTSEQVSQIATDLLEKGYCDLNDYTVDDRLENYVMYLSESEYFEFID